MTNVDPKKLVDDDLWLALKSAGVGTYHIDANAELRLSDECFAIFGFAPEEVEGDLRSWFLERVHADDRAELVAESDRLYTEQCDHVGGVFRYRAKDERWLWLKRTAMRTSEGEIVGTLQEVTDVVERARDARFESARSRTNAERLESLVRNAAVPIFLKDRDQRYVHANEAFLQGVASLVGRRIDVVGLHQADFDPKGAPLVEKRDREVLRTGRPVTFDERFETVDGDVYCALTLFPIRDAENEIIGLGGVAMDTTAQHRAEESLLASNQELAKWAQAFRVAGVGLAITKADALEIDEANVAFCRKFRWPDDAHGRPVEDLFAPDSAREGLEHFLLADRSGHERFEATLIREDGERFPALIDITVVWNAQGRIAYRFLTIVEISELRERERALRVFERVVDQMPIGMLLADLEEPNNPGSFRFRRGNAAAFQNSTRAREEIEGRRVDEDFPAILETGLADLYMNALLTGQPQRLPTVRYGEGDEESIFDTRAVKVDDQMIAIMYEDVTERQHTLEQLEVLNAELRRSNEELANFAAIASHDLKSPLRSIVSFSDLLEEELGSSADEHVTTSLGFIRSNAARLQTLVTDLLDYAQAGQRERQFDWVDLDALCKQIVEQLVAPIEEANARVEWHDLPRVWGDRGMLGQLLQNLIVNGMKFRRDEPPVVTLRSQRRSAPWCISVEDNGIGIDPMRADDIFGAFKRLHPSTKFAGSGIGLAVCKKIAHHHGGRIWYESKVDVGTTMYFTIAGAETLRET